jgi:hypothetical protein
VIAGARAAGLVRAIGRWDFTAAIINGVIGSGIFSLPSVLAQAHGRGALHFRPGRARHVDHAALHGRGGEPLHGGGRAVLYVREAFGRDAGFQAAG